LCNVRNGIHNAVGNCLVNNCIIHTLAIAEDLEEPRRKRRSVDAAELFDRRLVKSVIIFLLVHGERAQELRTADRLGVKLERALRPTDWFWEDVHMARSEEQIVWLVVRLHNMDERADRVELVVLEYIAEPRETEGQHAT